MAKTIVRPRIKAGKWIDPPLKPLDPTYLKRLKPIICIDQEAYKLYLEILEKYNSSINQAAQKLKDQLDDIIKKYKT